MPAVPKAIVDVKNKLSARVLMNPMLLKVGTHSLHPFSSLFIDLGATLHPFLFSWDVWRRPVIAAYARLVTVDEDPS